ncbi:hypothetical protein DFAR_3700002 [Desulfarculales bacterium]
MPLRGPAQLSKGLASGLAQTGLPHKRYLDNGPVFRSYHLEEVTASLGIALVHSPPYVPQSRGKIEKFFAPSGPVFPRLQRRHPVVFRINLTKAL